MAEFVGECAKTMIVDDIIAACRQRFPGVVLLSKSSLDRYLQLNSLPLG